MKLKLLVAAAALSTLTIAGAQAADAPKPNWSQEITECDRQASHGDDPWHVAPPKERKEINFDTAIPACLEAVKKDPNNPRLNYQMGRLYGYSGQWEKAMPYRMKAVDLKYPQSLFVIGFLYFTGQTIDKKDVCKAAGMWRESAKLNRLAAQVALPHFYKQGVFKDCGLTIPDDELLGYVEAAAKQTKGDFYTDLLVAELRNDLKK
jgi:TPR repeat protein